jgi:polyferredoxin
MGYPRGLIRYSTENALRNRWSWKEIIARVRRPRVIVYASVMLAIVAATVIALALRVPVKMDVMRDRASLSREVEGGRIENVFRIQLMNTAEEPRHAKLSATSPGGALEVLADAPVLDMPALSTRIYTVRVRAEPGSPRGSQPIEFVLESGAAGGGASGVITIREKSRFLFP